MQDFKSKSSSTYSVSIDIRFLTYSFGVTFSLYDPNGTKTGISASSSINALSANSMVSLSKETDFPLPGSPSKTIFLLLLLMHWQISLVFSFGSPFSSIGCKLTCKSKSSAPDAALTSVE